MKILAHRGASREYPENTLPAFRRAVEIGVDEIETDLVATRDGVILLHHDEYLQYGGKTFAIRQLLLEEVKKIKEGVPTLDAVLEELGSVVTFCLELKTLGLVKNTAQLIKKHHLSEATHVTSFHGAEVLAMKKLFPQLSYSWTFSRLPENIAKDLRREGLNTVSCSCVDVSWDQIRLLSAEGIKTRLYTVNDLALAERCEAGGVDAIFTDDPEKMKKFRKAR